MLCPQGTRINPDCLASEVAAKATVAIKASAPQPAARLYLRRVLSTTVHQFLPIPILHSSKHQRRFLRFHKHARQLIALQIAISNPTKRHRTRLRLLVQYGKESTLQIHTSRFPFEPVRYGCDALKNERRFEGSVNRRFGAFLASATLGFLRRRCVVGFS